MHTPRVGRTKYVTAIANRISISEDGDLVFAYTDRNDSGTYTCFGRDNENNIVAKASLDVNCEFTGHFKTLQNVDKNLKSRSLKIPLVFCIFTTF